jgi:signal transduction histidine kinase
MKSSLPSRHARHLDRDVVASRAVVALGLAVFLGSVYAASLGLGKAVTGEFPNTLFSAAATTIVAVTFRRAILLVQRLANRVVHGERATPYEVLSQFSEQVAGTVATEDVPARMAWMIARGTGAASSVVWLRVGGELIPAASWPDGARRGPVPLNGEEMPLFDTWTRAAPIRHQGELLGALTVRRRDATLTPTEDKLLEDVASQAGIVLRNVRLTAELTARVDEVSRQASALRASRRRIVAAADGERRRIERNIHDGAQQYLVALAVKARMARTAAERDPSRVSKAIDELRHLTEGTLATLRELTQGIYPPALASQGLGPALQTHAGTAGVAARIRAQRLGRYEPAVEAAVYFSCLEAVQNASKHAAEASIEVRVTEEDGTLMFEVADDGPGFDPDTMPRGTGLQGMTDRLAAVGGSLEVLSSPAGTTVRGTVPIPDGST